MYEKDEKTMNPTDAELVQQVRQGDQEAFSELMARHQDYVHGLAYHLVENFEDARDLAQDAFVRAYLHLGQLRDPARFGPWLRRITQRVCLDWLGARAASRKALEADACCPVTQAALARLEESAGERSNQAWLGAIEGLR